MSDFLSRESLGQGLHLKGESKEGAASGERETRAEKASRMQSTSWGNRCSKKATVCSVCPKEARLLHENGVYSETHELTWQTNIWVPRGEGCVGRSGLTFIHTVCVSRSVMSDSL